MITSEETVKETADMGDTILDEALVSDGDDASDKEPRVYEVGYHIVPAITEEKVSEEAKTVREAIESNGGVVISEEVPQHVTLSYTMYRTKDGKKEKFDSAYFGGIKFEASPEKVLAIKEKLDSYKHILRYVIFKSVKENTRSDIRVSQPARVDKKSAPAVKAPVVAEKPPEPVSEAELDKTIDELVVE